MDVSKRVAKQGVFKLAEADCNVWRHRADPGVTRDDVLRPEYWVHVVRDVKEYDEIKVVATDGSFYSWLLVEAVTNTGIFVRELMCSDGVVEAVIASEGTYRVEFAGRHRWRIVRCSDSAVIDHGYPNKEAADKALDALSNGSRAVSEQVSA